MQACPDLYQNDRYYVPCKADFSDLNKKVEFVLKNYDKFTDMRKRARDLLVNYWEENVVKNFAKAIKKAMK